MSNELQTKDKLFIVIPAYNEYENIAQCINDWYPIARKCNELAPSCLVIINDGSKDHTYDKVQEIAKTHPLLMPLTKENGGHGSAVLFGYHYAIEHNADWIFQTDSDGQTDPDEFEQFWEKRDEYDAIIGNRIVRGDGRYRKFVEKVVCLLLRFIFKVKIQDANAPFRLMKASMLRKYIDKLPKDFNIPNIMLTTYFVYFKEKVLFLPITFNSRKKGNNSINLRKIIKIGWKAIGDFKKLRREIDNSNK